MKVLAIETSCDETAVAVYDGDKGLLANRVFSQIELHRRHGGVVPELASRDHIERLLPMIDETIAEAGLTPQAIDGIAYTAGPGLIGALLVGASVARSLGYAWGVPVIGVHHLEGHLLAPELEPEAPEFPFVALQVSGGHTMLVVVAGVGRYRVLGETLDDAAGEAFDKTAKLLGLDYPGGPALAALASAGGTASGYFLRPMLDRPGLDFSFSGLKTAVVVAIRGTDARWAGARRRRAGFRERNGRNARRQVAAGAPPDRNSTRSWSRAASAPIGACARISRARSRPQVDARVLSAAGVLHRQRCDDRGRGPSPSRGRRARRLAGARPRALAARRTRSTGDY